MIPVATTDRREYEYSPDYKINTVYQGTVYIQAFDLVAFDCTPNTWDAPSMTNEFSYDIQTGVPVCVEN